MRAQHKPPIATKQPIDNLGHVSASIPGERPSGLRKRRNRAVGIVCSAAIARVEGFVEALAALIGTAEFEEEQERANNAIIGARICVRKKFDLGYLSAAERDAIDSRIDRAEARISDSIRLHRTRIAEVIVPEVRRCAQSAERVA